PRPCPNPAISPLSFSSAADWLSDTGGAQATYPRRLVLGAQAALRAQELHPHQVILAFALDPASFLACFRGSFCGDASAALGWPPISCSNPSKLQSHPMWHKIYHLRAVA
uniref:Uncharacterized protein n=1 Tax=Aegilops tauschii subsp. strangulata TaxID=200361 RepID=A0A453JSC5_AEGTS